MVVVALGSVACGRILAAQATAGLLVNYQEWRFDTAANPAPPEVGDDLLPGAQAEIVPGKLSVEWQQQLAGFGARTGYWDLGKSGRITLTMGQPQVTFVARRIIVHVWEWFDGFVYGEPVSVTVLGAALADSDGREVTSGPVGAWVVSQTEWEAPAGANVDTVVVTGSATGAMVDQIVVETVSALPEPAFLSIRRPGNSGTTVEVSWPASVTGGTLEANTNLTDPEGWKPVEAAVKLEGGRFTVTVDAGDVGQFFRLKR